MPELKLQCFINAEGIISFNESTLPCLVTGFLNSKSTETLKIFDLRNAGAIFGQLYVTKELEVTFRLLSSNPMIDYDTSMTNIASALVSQAKKYF